MSAALLGLGCLTADAQTMPLAERIAQCSACHGADGNSALEKIPSLAGQPAFFILNQLFLMREGVRKVEPMAAIVKDLKDEDLEALSQHYSKLPPKLTGEPVDTALAQQGEPIAARRRCTSCHGRTLAGDTQIPRLAKQRIDYMIYAMKAYLNNERAGADTNMTAAIIGTSDADLQALANFAASR